MLSHMLCDTMNVLKETDMAQLIYFVVSNCLDLELFLDIFHIIGGSCDRCHTGPREADLAGGAELVYHIRIAGSLTLF